MKASISILALLFMLCANSVAQVADSTPQNAALLYYRAMLVSALDKENFAEIKAAMDISGTSPYVLEVWTNAGEPAQEVARLLRRAAQMEHCDFQFLYAEGDVGSRQIEAMLALGDSCSVRLAYLLESGRRQEAEQLLMDAGLLSIRMAKNSHMLTSMVAMSLTGKCLGVFQQWLSSEQNKGWSSPQLTQFFDKHPRPFQCASSIKADWKWAAAYYKTEFSNWSELTFEKQKTWLLGFQFMLELPKASQPIFEAIFPTEENQQELLAANLRRLPELFRAWGVKAGEGLTAEMLAQFDGTQKGIEQAFASREKMLTQRSIELAKKGIPLIASDAYQLFVKHTLAANIQWAQFQLASRGQAALTNDTVFDPATGKPFDVISKNEQLVIRSKGEGQTALDLSGHRVAGRNYQGWILAAEKGGSDLPWASALGYRLARKDIELIEKTLPLFLAEEPGSDSEILEELAEYQRQYIGILKDGRKLAYIQLIHFWDSSTEKSTFRHQLVNAEDRELECIQLLYNFTSNKFFDITIQ